MSKLKQISKNKNFYAKYTNEGDLEIYHISGKKICSERYESGANSYDIDCASYENGLLVYKNLIFDFIDCGTEVLFFNNKGECVLNRYFESNEESYLEVEVYKDKIVCKNDGMVIESSIECDLTNDYEM